MRQIAKGAALGLMVVLFYGLPSVAHAQIPTDLPPGPLTGPANEGCAPGGWTIQPTTPANCWYEYIVDGWGGYIISEINYLDGGLITQIPRESFFGFTISSQGVSQDWMGPVSECQSVDGVVWGFSYGNGCDLGNNGNWGMDEGGSYNYGAWNCRWDPYSNCSGNIGVFNCVDNWGQPCQNNVGAYNCSEDGECSNNIGDMNCGGQDACDNNAGTENCTTGTGMWNCSDNTGAYNCQWGYYSSDCSYNAGTGNCYGLGYHQYCDGRTCESTGLLGCEPFPIGYDMYHPGNLPGDTANFSFWLANAAGGNYGSGNLGALNCGNNDLGALNGSDANGDCGTTSSDTGIENSGNGDTGLANTADNQTGVCEGSNGSVVLYGVGDQCAGDLSAADFALYRASQGLNNYYWLTQTVVPYLTGTVYSDTQQWLCLMAGVQGEPTGNPEFPPCQENGYVETDATTGADDAQSIAYNTLQNGLWGQNGGLTTLNNTISWLNGTALPELYDSVISGDCAAQTPPGSEYCQLFGFAQWEWGQLLTGWGFPVPSNPGGLIPSNPAAASTQPAGRAQSAAAAVLQ